MGYGHFSGGPESHNIHAFNLKRGVRIEFSMGYSKDKHEVNFVKILTRNHHRKHSGEIVGVYVQYISFIKNGIHWTTNQKGTTQNIGTWGEVTGQIKHYLQTLEGLDVPKKVHKGLIQNIVLSNLRDKLHKNGFKNVRFIVTAKTENKYSILSLNACDCYLHVCIALRPGELAISRGQESGVRNDRIPIPTFEDPQFNPDLLYDMAIKTIERMQKLKKDYKKWNQFRIAALDEMTNDYKIGW